MSHGRTVLKKRIRRIYADASEAARLCGVDVSLDLTGKHPSLVFEADGVKRVQMMANTPRDADNAISGTRRQVEKILREMTA